MTGGGGEPLSPRRPSTRTHAPAIMFTPGLPRGCQSRAAPRLSLPLLAQHPVIHVCPTSTGAAGRWTCVQTPTSVSTWDSQQRLTRLTHHVGAAARRQVESCAPVRSSFATFIAGRTLYRLRDPRSVLVENPIVLVLARLLCRGEGEARCPFGYPPGALRCRCTPPGAVHAAALRQGRWRCIPIDRQREDPA